jgi:hypothetical protein
VPQRLMDEQKQSRHHSKASSTLVKTILIFHCILCFLMRKLLSNERGFKMLKALRYSWRPNWGSCSFGGVTCFQRMFKRVNNNLIWRRLLWIQIKQFVVSLYFVFIFLHLFWNFISRLVYIIYSLYISSQLFEKLQHMPKAWQNRANYLTGITFCLGTHFDSKCQHALPLRPAD